MARLLIPYVETAFFAAAEKMLAGEGAKNFFDDCVEPRLVRTAADEKTLAQIGAELDRRTPDIAAAADKVLALWNKK